MNMVTKKQLLDALDVHIADGSRIHEEFLKTLVAFTGTLLLG